MIIYVYVPYPDLASLRLRLFDFVYLSHISDDLTVSVSR